MASSTPTSRTINIYINSPSAQKTLNDLNARAEKLTNSIKKGEAAGKDMSKSMTQLAATKSKISELEGVISGKMAPSLNMARTRANELRRELERMSADAPGYAQKFAEFQQAQKIFQGIQQEIRGVGSVLNGTQKQVSAFWSQVRTISIGSFIGNGLQSLIDKAAGYFSDIIGNNAKLSDSLSDIQKATNLSAKEVDYLNTALAKLDTRTSMDQLREIAVGLGQIGQAANESSVAAIDKIVVALGDEFGGGAREITTVLGVLRNNLQDIKSGNYGDDMLRIGNALNVLGAEGLATAPVVVDFANRMSGVASTFKLSSGQILGTAAAMQELGIPAERGSTAFIKLLQKMSTETKTYAHVASYAGISTKDFIDLLNTDMLAALSKVSEGVNAAGQNNVQLGKILKDLDADGSGAGEVLSKLGTNAELLEGKIELATGALQNNNSISQEFSLKNNNLAADLAKVEKAFSSLATSPGANGFVSKAIGAASIFAGLLTFIFGHLGTITTLIGLYAAAWILANNQMIIHNAQLLYYNARIAISKTLLTIASAAQVIHTVLVMAMTRAYAAATPVVTTFNAVFAATPFGAALTLLTLLGAGIIATTALVSNYTTATKELTKAKVLNNEIDTTANKNIAETRAKIATLVAVINDHNASQYVRIRALNELKALAPEYLNNLTLENSSLAEGKRLLEEYNKHLFNKAALEAAQSLQSDKLKKDIELQEAEYRLQQKLSNGKTDISDLTDDEQKLLSGARRAAPFSASVIDALKGSKNSSAALEAINNIKAQRAALAREIDLTNTIVKERYTKLQETIKEGPKTDDGNKKTGGGYESELTDAEIAKLKRLEEKREEYNRKVLAMEAEMKAASESNDEAERQRIINKYDTLEAEARKLFAQHQDLARQLANLSAAEQQELDNLNKKLFEKLSAKEYADTLTKVKTHFNQVRQTVNDSYLNGEISQAEHSRKMIQLEREEYEARAKVAADYSDTVAKAQGDIEKFQEEASDRKVKEAEADRTKNNDNTLAGLQAAIAIARIGSKAELDAKKALLLAKLEMDKQYYGESSQKAIESEATTKREIESLDREFFQKKIQLWQDVGNQISTIYSEYLSFLNQRDQQQLDNDSAANDKKRDNLQKQLNSKKISQAKYDKEVAKLDEEKAKKEQDLKVKQFKRDKAAKLVQGGIDLAAGIAKIWSVWGANLPEALILTGIETATNLAQMAFIAAAKPPEYATGRRPTGNGGIPEGPNHANNGIKLVDGITGQVVGEMEGQEAILSKKTVENNPELANLLLDSSMYNGGKRVALPWLYRQAAPINTGRAIAAMQFNRMYAAGGFASQKTPLESATASGGTFSMDEESLAVFKDFIFQLQQGVKANVVYTEWDKVNREIADLKKAGSAKPY